MKVYQVQPGAGLDGLPLDERSEPMPAPGQVLIQVKVVSLNDRDLLISIMFGSIQRGGFRCHDPHTPVFEPSILSSTLS